jgi:hypothetical protein
MQEVMVVDPVDAGEGEGERVDDQRGPDGREAGETVLQRDFQFEHHDGDDDGDDAVGERFEAGRAGVGLCHSFEMTGTRYPTWASGKQHTSR